MDGYYKTMDTKYKQNIAEVTQQSSDAFTYTQNA